MKTCPPDRKPWRHNSDGAMPLIVPAAMLEGARKAWPKIWVEASPVIPTGRIYTQADIA